MYELVYTNKKLGRESKYEYDSLKESVDQLSRDVYLGVSPGWDNIEIRPTQKKLYRVKVVTTNSLDIRAHSKAEALAEFQGEYPAHGETSYEVEELR